jgi:heme-degrading monooxygenase HmoA
VSESAHEAALGQPLREILLLDVSGPPSFCSDKEAAMYGTIAHVRARPGMEARLKEEIRRFEEARTPGAIASYVYRMDADCNDYYIAIIFESKAAYVANAQSAEQNTRYQALLELLISEPAWHDGEIVAVALPQHDGLAFGAAAEAMSSMAS